MTKINVGRVVLGGLVAGLVLTILEYVLNEPILGKQWETAMAALNQPPISGGTLAWYVVLTFILGIAVVWLYAAIRPRFGAGPKTAIITGLAVWFFIWLWSFGGQMATMDLFPIKLVWISIVWGLFEVPIATLVGAWLYKEG